MITYGFLKRAARLNLADQTVSGIEHHDGNKANRTVDWVATPESHENLKKENDNTGFEIIGFRLPSDCGTSSWPEIILSLETQGCHSSKSEESLILWVAEL